MPTILFQRLSPGVRVVISVGWLNLRDSISSVGLPLASTLVTIATWSGSLMPLPSQSKKTTSPTWALVPLPGGGNSVCSFWKYWIIEGQ
ncbi:hypothetical protein D3C86_1460220 [compost metagenome]